MRNLVFISFYLMIFVLDKDLSPCDPSLLLKAIITAGSLTCCKENLDLLVRCHTPVRNQLLEGPVLVHLSVWIVCNKKFMRKKEVEWDLEEMVPLLRTLDPMTA